jgi:lysyl-tRNA synthetase, class II
MASQESSEQTLQRIMRERRDKAAGLREAGSEPYRNDFRPTHRLAEIRARYGETQPSEPAPGIQPVDGEVLRVAGRVLARRGFGKTSFVPIRDEAADLQLFLNIEHLASSDFETILPSLDVGDIVGAEGAVFWTKRGELSLLATRLFILTKSLRPLPDKWHGLTDVETRYRQRYLDLAVNPEVREVFRKRTEIVRGIRRFLDARKYLEVETPMMHPIIGGAAARPFVTHHNALDMKLYMRIAPELYLKRLVVGGFERVYEINRNFRNEGLSRQHNPEFTMLELYQAYATYEDLMDLTEELVTELAREVIGETRIHWDGADIDLKAPWRRLTVKDAVVEFGRVSPEVFDDPLAAAEAAIGKGVPAQDVARTLLEPLLPKDVADLAQRFGARAAQSTDGARGLLEAFGRPEDRPALARAIVERYADASEARVRAGAIGYRLFEEVAEAELVQPTLLTQFPLAVSPLARRNEADPAFCDRFELIVAGREIANAFSELNDPDDQRARFEAQVRARAQGDAEAMDYDEDYCRALELGMPPAAGEGIGIDRLAMLLTGQASIRDVILFPLLRPE